MHCLIVVLGDALSQKQWSSIINIRLLIGQVYRTEGCSVVLDALLYNYNDNGSITGSILLKYNLVNIQIKIINTKINAYSNNTRSSITLHLK